MFSYEFQKQLVVSAVAIFIYVIAVYTILDFANMVMKAIYKFGKNVITKFKEKGYLK
jgi:small neutral amino acid transporter SnatA (MarC family)